MAPKSRAKRAKAGAIDPNPKHTVKSKLNIDTHEDEGHCGTSVRSEDATLQDTANAAANVFVALLDSMEPVDPQESAEVPSSVVLPECNGRLRDGQPTEDELEVANFFVTEEFRDRYASGSVAATMVFMKDDPDFSPPVQSESRPKRNLTRQGSRS